MSTVFTPEEISKMSPKTLKLYTSYLSMLEMNIRITETQKMARKKYYENNKEAMDAYRKEYSITNRAKACETSKKYYAANKLEILAARKEKYTCIACDKNISTHHKWDHEKTKTHLENINLKNKI